LKSRRYLLLFCDLLTICEYSRWTFVRVDQQATTTTCIFYNGVYHSSSGRILKIYRWLTTYFNERKDKLVVFSMTALIEPNLVIMWSYLVISVIWPWKLINDYKFKVYDLKPWRRCMDYIIILDATTKCGGRSWERYRQFENSHSTGFEPARLTRQTIGCVTLSHCILT